MATRRVTVFKRPRTFGSKATTTRTFKRRRLDRNRTSGIVIQNPRVGGFMGIEKKFYDTSLINGVLGAPTDASGGEHDPSSIVMINTVEQGDGEQQRDGRQITMDKIMLSGQINIPKQTNQTAADGSCAIFIAIVVDKQTNGAQISSELVFKNTGSNGATATNLFRNLQYVKRFDVLGTKKITFGTLSKAFDGTNMEQAGQQKHWKFNIPLHQMRVNFTGTTKSIANISDNSLHVIAFTSGTDLAPVISYNARLRYWG